jgi:hypothetical protein
VTAKRTSVWAIVRSVSCAGFAYAADGEQLAVARPRRPAVALAVAHVALQHQAESFLRELPDDDYTVVGWLAADGASVVDDDGNRTGKLQPGDSLVSLTSGPKPTSS